MRRRIIFLVFIFFLGLIPITRAAQQPIDSLRVYIDKTFDLFKTYDSNNTSVEYKTKFEEKTLKLAQDIFAFDIMARMVLGRYWRELNKCEQKEFQCLFIELVAQNYFDKILQHVEDIKKFPKKNIKILGQRMYTSRKAEVMTKIKYNDKYIPINYRFVFIENKWKIYDVYVEGISLIRNYRSQFQDLLLKKSPSDVILELRKKLKDTWCKKQNSAKGFIFKWLCAQCKEGELYAH